MPRKLTFVFIASFWVTMNVLLWRSEFGGRHELGNSIPVQVVWQKMLTAPDDSSLEILFKGKKIGFCRWVANIGEEAATGKVSSEQPEGMVKRLTGYTLAFDGNFLLPDNSGRFRFEFAGQFATNQVWKDLKLKTLLRPNVWEFRAQAATQTIDFKMTDATGNWEHQFQMADLQNPEKIMREFGVPALPGLLGSFGLPGKGNAPSLALGLNWTAHRDFMRIGHSQVRVYKLQARLLDRYHATAWISLVGEIMRVELPNDIILINEALTNI